MTTDTTKETQPPEVPRIDVVRCLLCRCDHLNVPIHAYELPHPVFSHWYDCPIGKGPVGVTAVPENTRPIDGEVMAKLLEAEKNGRRIVLVYSLKPSGEAVRFWKTFNFPHAHHQLLFDWIAKDLVEKTAPPPKVELKIAEVDEETPPLVAEAIRAQEAK